jgi:hypothetical protein
LLFLQAEAAPHLHKAGASGYYIGIACSFESTKNTVLKTDRYGLHLCLTKNSGYRQSKQQVYKETFQQVVMLVKMQTS